MSTLPHLQGRIRQDDSNSGIANDGSLNLWIASQHSSPLRTTKKRCFHQDSTPDTFPETEVVAQSVIVNGPPIFCWILSFLFAIGVYSVEAQSGYLSADQITGTALNRNDRSVVVLIHGWTGENSQNVPDDSFADEDWNDLVKALHTRLGLNEWKLLLYHWEKDASTGQAIDGGIFGITGFANAREAANNAFINGKRLAESLCASAPELRKVVFIAHSAGSWVAYRAIDKLLQINPFVIVNLVLLDPFVPGVDPSVATILNRDTMSQLDAFTSSDRIYRLENYYAIDYTDVDFDWGSGGGSHSTAQTFTWRGSDINHRVDYVPNPITLNAGPYYSVAPPRDPTGHGGPLRFYADSVKATTGPPVASGLANAPWDFTSVGFYRGLVHEAFLLPAITIEPHAPLQPTPAGVPVQLSISANRANEFLWFRNGQPISNATGSTYSFIASSATAGKYVARLKNGYGVIFSETAEVLMNDPVLSAPTAFTATAISSSQINLSWSHNGSNVNGFRIERALGGTNGWTQLKTIGATVRSYSDTSLLPGTMYSYRIRAYSTVDSAWSASRDASTFPLASVIYSLSINAVDLAGSQLLAVNVSSWAGVSSDFRTSTTTFTRTAGNGTLLNVSAPATLAGGRNFQYWLLDGDKRLYTTSTTALMNSNHALIAVYGSPPVAIRTLSSLSIEGPSSLDERSAANYKAKAAYSDGMEEYVSATWNDDSSSASISSAGWLDVGAVTSDRTVEIEASFTSGGVTKTKTKDVTILNTDAVSTYTLTRNVEGNGEIGSNPPGSSFADDTWVYVHANPGDGYVFSHWSGSTTGTEADIYVVMDRNQSVTAHFVPDSAIGSLRVNISPPQAVAEGAAWKFDLFTAWRPSGDLQDGITPRTNKYVYFKDIPGWVTPDPIKTNVLGGQTTALNATYREILGSVQVTLSPDQARAAGARWRLDGGTWVDSGVLLADVSPGAHTIEFLPVSGWAAPSNQAVSVVRGITSTRSGDYTPPVGLPIINSVTPRTGPLGGGTMVTIEGANFQPGATVTIGGVLASSISVVGPTRITAVSPPRASYGTVPIVLTSGGQTVTQANGFSYLNPLGSNIDLVGQIGGNVEAVAVVGNLCFYGEGASLVVADFTNSAAPVVVGRIALPGNVKDLFVSNGMAYAAVGGSGLYALDVSAPAAPVIIGFYDTEGTASGVALLNGVAYVADGSSLQILDVSAPSMIVRLGSFTTAGIAQKVSVGTIGTEKYAFVAERNYGMQAIRVTVPGAATEVANVAGQSTNGITDVKLVGTRLYCSDWNGLVKIYDASSPSALLLIGTTTNVGSSPFIDVVGDRLYTGTTFLRVRDLTILPTPTQLGSFGIGSSAYRVAVANGLAFVAMGGAGLQVVSVGNPGSMSQRALLPTLGSVEDVFVAGGIAYVGNNTGLHTVNVSTPERPVRLATFASSRVTDIVVVGGTATLVNYGDTTVRVVNVANPSALALLGNYTGVEAWNVALKGSAPVIAAATKDAAHRPKLDVLNLSSPSSPQSSSSILLDSADGTAAAVAVADDWAFVARNGWADTSNNAVDVVNLSIPSAPQKVGSVAISDNYFRDIAVSSDGNYVYLPRASGIQVINTTAKASPALAQVINPSQTSGSFDAVEVVGNRLVFNEGGFVFVYDLTQPASPLLAGYYETSAVANGLSMAGDLIYVADASTGISILRLKDVDKPTIAITSPTTSTTFATATEQTTLGGTATDLQGVVRVTWENTRGGGGVATGTSVWTIPDIKLAAGVNVITVTAEDANGNLANDSLSITATLPDITPPVIVITGPLPDEEFATEEEITTLSGSVADNQSVTSINWADDRGHAGVATLTGQTWSISGLALDMGPRAVTVTATDGSGNTASDTVMILRVQPDMASPVVAIQFPTSAAEFATEQATVNLSGEASDDRGIAQITWRNSRGGAGGLASATPWAVNEIVLQPGLNNITIAVTDEAGKTSEDNLAVTYTPRDADNDGLPDAWERQFFGNTSAAGTNTDSAKSGIPDLLKFAFGLDPNLPNANALPLPSSEDDGQNNFFLFKYRQLMVPGNLVYQVGVSHDLITWDYTESQIEQVGPPIPNGDGLTEEVTVRLKNSEEKDGKTFLRLKVLQSP